jgi:hypothetical protein
MKGMLTLYCCTIAALDHPAQAHDDLVLALLSSAASSCVLCAASTSSLAPGGCS